jgi:hypothetical protein
MLISQRYDFGIVVNSENGARVIPVRFLNPGTAKRFYVQMGAWTGKPSANGAESPQTGRLTSCSEASLIVIV